MTRWVFKRWVWAAVLGATVVGAAVAQQAGKDAPSGPPKVGDVMTLKFRDGPDRQIKVLKSEKQADGSYLTEVKDTQSGEVFTLVDRTADAPATGKATPPAGKPTAGNKATPTPPEPPKPGDGPPKAKPRTSDPLMPGAKDPMPLTPMDKKLGIDDKKVFGSASKSPAAATATPTDPPEEEKPGLLKRIFGRKKPTPPAPSTPAGSSASGNANVVEPPRANNSSTAMPPPVRPTPGTTNAPPVLTPGTSAEPPRTAPVRPVTPPTAPPTFTPPASTQPVPQPLPNFPMPAPSTPAPPVSAPPAFPSTPPVAAPALPPSTPMPPVSAPVIPSTPALPPIPSAPATSTPALPPIPAAPGAPAIPAIPSVPAIPPVPSTPTIPTTPAPSGLPPIPVPPGGVSVARPAVTQASHSSQSPLAVPAVSPAVMHDIQPYITAIQTQLAPSQRAMALRAMAGCRHGTTDAVKDLIFRAGQNDPSAMVRVACIEELCKLGYRTPSFMEFLTTASLDKNPDVRDAAKDATFKLTPQR